MSVESDSFPRGIALPKQSPLFWVAQKDRYLRQLLIKDIEAITGRALLVYFTDCGSPAQIDDKDEPYLTELLGKCNAPEFDLMLETNGGLTDCTENVVATLRNWAKPFRVIVPSRAKSNGTLIALAGKTIVMGANSELGPIDPFIQGMPCTFIMNAAADGQQVDPMLMQFATHAIQQTKKLATSVLETGMMKAAGLPAINKTVDALSTREVYHSHGSVIDRGEAASLGLNVTYLPPEDDLWQKLWLLRCMYAYDANAKRLSKIFESAHIGQGLEYPPPTSP